MSELSQRLAQVQERIAQAAHSAGRKPDSVQLLAVSKTFPVSAVLEAAGAGLRAFAENRIQEAARKIPEVGQADSTKLEWHFVGQLQRNKAAKAIELFDVIHSVDRPELALELDRRAGARGERQRILIHVNIDGEAQKGGVSPGDLEPLLTRIDRLPHLSSIGLMALPRACTDPEEVRPSFVRLRELLEAANRNRPGDQRLSELSMGMSADFEIAIQEGATCVRIGTAIFGQRRTK